MHHLLCLSSSRQALLRPRIVARGAGIKACPFAKPVVASTNCDDMPLGCGANNTLTLRDCSGTCSASPNHALYAGASPELDRLHLAQGEVDALGVLEGLVGTRPSFSLSPKACAGAASGDGPEASPHVGGSSHAPPKATVHLPCMLSRPRVVFVG